MSEYSIDEEEKSRKESFDDQSMDDMEFSDKNQVNERLETQNDEFNLGLE